MELVDIKYGVLMCKLLNEMDGFEKDAKQVVIVVANRDVYFKDYNII